MPVHIFTARVMSGGEVVAVRQEPFLVLAEGEDESQGAIELWHLAEVLREQADEIEEARHDPGHRRHHWWIP